MKLLVQEIEVRNLRVELFDEVSARHQRVLSDVSFRLRAGQALGVTGESGSGKTTLSLALSGLLPASARVAAERFRVVLGEQHGNGTNDWVATGALNGLLRRLCGRFAFTLFQEPRSSLNPHRTIRWQLERCAIQDRLEEHTWPLFGHVVPGRRLHASQTIDALSEVGLESDVARCYPHELSTGMCQRVFLAMRLLRGSEILVADEPFASVDAATQFQLTDHMRDWLRSRGKIMLLVSHDLELLRRLTDHTLVLYHGQVAESGPTRDVLAERPAAHPYTRLLSGIARSGRGLSSGSSLAPGADSAECCFAARCGWREPNVCIEAVPTLRGVATEARTSRDEPYETHEVRCVRHPLPLDSRPGRAGKADEEPSVEAARPVVLSLECVSKEFSSGWLRRRTKQVLNEISFDVIEHDRLGIMGPSGGGKTTLARIIVGVLPATAGAVQFTAGGRRLRITTMSSAERVRFRRCVQLLHQDADLVLDPAARIGDSLVEAYQVFRPMLAVREAYRLAARLLEELSLPASILEAYPYRLSGGERKRVALARCLAALGCPFEPPPETPWRVLVMDEPTAGVDVVLQAILTRFLLWAQRRMRLSYLVISHDEDFVRQFCLRTLRMENGHVVSEDVAPSLAGE